MQQAEDRAHRHGQTLPVNVYFLLARGTTDERRYPPVCVRGLFGRIGALGLREVKRERMKGGGMECWGVQQLLVRVASQARADMNACVHRLPVSGACQGICKAVCEMRCACVTLCRQLSSNRCSGQQPSARPQLACNQAADIVMSAADAAICLHHLAVSPCKPAGSISGPVLKADTSPHTHFLAYRPDAFVALPGGSISIAAWSALKLFTMHHSTVRTQKRRTLTHIMQQCAPVCTWIACQSCMVRQATG